MADPAYFRASPRDVRSCGITTKPSGTATPLKRPQNMPLKCRLGSDSLELWTQQWMGCRRSSSRRKTKVATRKAKVVGCSAVGIPAHLGLGGRSID